jgi:hypothetical protein
MKKFPFLFLVFFTMGFLSILSVSSQNAIVGSGFTDGWGFGSCPTTSNTNFEYFSSSVGSSYIRTENANGTGNQYFRLGVDWGGTIKQNTITPGSDVEVSSETEYSLSSDCTTSGAMYVNVSSTSHNYIFKTADAGASPSFDLIFFVVQGDVRTIDNVAKSPTTVYPGQTVTVTATLSGSLSTGQGVYLRYTDDGWTTSTIIEMSGSVTSYTADINASKNTADANLSYYTFTSGDGLTISHDAADWYSINLNNNSGSNYSYTVQSSWTTAGGATSWGNTASWDAGAIPESNQPVTIENNLTLAQDVTVSSITVNNSISFTIEDNGSMTVNNAFTNNGTFTIQSNSDGTGSLKTNGTVSGNVTCERYIVGHGGDNDHGWHFLASPVTTFNIDGSDFDPGDGATPNDLYGWAESTGLWMNYKAGNPTQIVPGTGYFTAWNVTPDPVKAFSGTLNNANIPKSNLSYTEGSTNTGWHLLGNPFPCALTWATSWSLSNVSTTAQIWHEGNASFSLISSGGTIPATQGFMIEVTEATNSLTIPIADRFHSGQAWYKDDEINKIKLTAYDPERSTAQESIIRFNENATSGFEHEFDAHFLSGFAPQFFSVVDNTHAVSCNTLTEISEQLSIPFSFIKNSSSDFYIEVEGIENLFPQTIVSLVDLKTNTTQNLLENPVYTFESSEGDDVERFLIQFGVLGLDEQNLENKLNFYVYNNTLNVVNNDLQAGTIQIFDMLGQQVLKKNYSGQENSIKLNLPAAYYIVRIISGKNIVNGKIHVE